jgi:antitoxin (DNA-binding transcriptional repressor) of toxin-antitoxin stability system
VISAGIRDLKNNLSRYLRRLRPGEVIAITDRGRVVAELRSPVATSGTTTPLTGGYARLLESGVIRPARDSGDPLGDLETARVRAAPRGTVASLIREDRGE